MEGSVGTNGQIWIFARDKILVGFLVAGIERLIQRSQSGLAVSELFELGPAQILVPIGIPIRLRDQVLVKCAIFFRVNEIQHA